MSVNSPAVIWALGVLVSGGSGASRIDRVEAYYTATHDGDFAAANRLLAPGARMWFEKREGPGEPWTAGSGAWDHWDKYFNGRVTRSGWQTRPDFVTAHGDETNDYYRLLEWRPWPMKLTWWFDDEGLMNGFLVEQVVGKGTTGSRLAEFKLWAKEKRPEELQYLMPNPDGRHGGLGRIDPSGDRPERWRKILVEWRREVGLLSVELGPPGSEESARRPAAR